MEESTHTQISEDIDPLDVFSGAVPVAQRKVALTSLLSTRSLAKRAGDPRFTKGREQLFSLATDLSARPEDRLLAIAESVRAVQVIKRLQNDTTKRLESAFVQELPPLALLSEADDRLNVARACRRASGVWLPTFLAKAVADEESGENARAELLAALLERSTTISAAVLLLASAFEKAATTTDKPPESLARRVTRTLSALRELILKSPLEAGDLIGEAIRTLVANAVPRRAVTDERIIVELARETILTVHEVARTRFSVAAQPMTFAGITYVRQLLGGGSWPDDLRDSLSLLVADLREALLLLGRQGIADQALLDQLQVVTNFPERARAIAKEISAQHPELPEAIRDWLERGKLRTHQQLDTAATEAVAREADSKIGFALDLADLVQQSLEPIKLALVDGALPSEQALREHVTRVELLVGSVEEVARKRRIGTLGKAGEEIDFAPKFFEFVGPTPSRRTVVRQPAIVRLRDDGQPGDVLVKGVVEQSGETK